MLKIKLPTNHLPERTYAVQIVFKELLGLDFQVMPVEGQKFAATIQLSQGHQLHFHDHFFGNFPSEKSYLSIDNIPKGIVYSKKAENHFLPEEDLPILFGNTQLLCSETEITCGIDIFATVFFMLTRWEEHVVETRDVHGRFPAAASLAFQHGFLQRPIVNELAEMVWNMLAHLGIQQPRKVRKFEKVITHDVDLPLFWDGTYTLLKRLAGDILKRGDFKQAAFSLKNYFATKWAAKPDPFDTFDYLMAIADKQGLQAHFFFLCGGQTSFDQSLPLGSSFMNDLLGKIQAAGHKIGLHPSYESIHDEAIFTKEKQALEQATKWPVRCGRQHFLRFEVPNTWQIWENHHMDWDSSLYYPEYPGFRCGICVSFPVFNFLSRKQLRVRELPLTAMDVTWTNYLSAPPEKMLADMRQLVKTVQKYNGSFVLLWHNSSFNTPAWKPYQPVFEAIVAMA